MLDCMLVRVVEDFALPGELGYDLTYEAHPYNCLLVVEDNDIAKLVGKAKIFTSFCSTILWKEKIVIVG